MHLPRTLLKRLLNRLSHGLGYAVVALACSSAAYAQSSDWPNGPIKFVAPFSAGGGGDILTRLYGQQIGKVLGTTLVIENRPGAGGNIGTVSVARSAPDGNTVLFGTNGTMGTNLALYAKPGFTVADFDPVAIFGTTTLVLVVDKDSPLRSVADVIAETKKGGGKIICANAGNGTASHMACTMWQQLVGVDVEHLALRGGSSALVELRSGRIPFLIDVIPYLAPHIKAGAIRALAVTSAQRTPSFPDVPTIAESGLPGYELVTWDGLFAPKGTPAARLDKLHAAVDATVADPEFRKSMMEKGTLLRQMPRKEFAEYVQRESVRMGALARKLGVTLD